jgi:hypothetical protein
MTGLRGVFGGHEVGVRALGLFGGEREHLGTGGAHHRGGGGGGGTAR